MFKPFLYAFNPVNIVKELLTVGTWGRVFIPLCIGLMVYLSTVWGSAWWQILSTCAGVVCVVLVAERKLTNYFWGLINCSLYGLASYQAGMYGDMSLNWVLYVPFQFIGLWMWFKNSEGEPTIDTRKLEGWEQYLALIVVVGLCWYGLYETLVRFGGEHPMYDSLNVVLSIAATILMAYRFVEQWYAWILVNFSGIALWTSAFLQNKGDGIPMLMMWVFFLANSIYGAICWYRWWKAAKRAEYLEDINNWRYGQGSH